MSLDVFLIVCAAFAGGLSLVRRGGGSERPYSDFKACLNNGVASEVGPRAGRKWSANGSMRGIDRSVDDHHE